ncbi:MAG: NusG domain II-containing protein [Nitrospirae bacterium]|nr:NusG domain II-containing protein [Nitrospirota bacterium]MBF0521307.1 NusG domain II-containing protein [Nitrospirota bacterium]MBF0534610.1 NusG domain II-containing protein [Nitrospirota bacterium]MBF0616346.1 NusG domain II-containing protein [Nitrospirota bacterium]
MSAKTLIKPLTYADVALFLLLIIASVSALFYVSAGVSKGAVVKIEVNNKLLYRYPLNEDRRIHLEFMDIEIKGGRVAVTDADCPNKLCVKQGFIDRGAIICLPNRTVITVEENGQNKRGVVDATT